MNPFILPASLSPVKAVVSVLCKVKFRCCGEEKPEKEVQWLFSSHLNDRNNARLLTMAKGCMRLTRILPLKQQGIILLPQDAVAQNIDRAGFLFRQCFVPVPVAGMIRR